MYRYLETSAVVRGLFREDERAARVVWAPEVRTITSTLTALETRRTLVRARHAGRLDSPGLRDLRRVLDAFLEAAIVVDLSREVLERASQPFPKEPVRSLDALHLASMIEAEYRIGPVRMFSFDKRILANCDALGLDVE